MLFGLFFGAGNLIFPVFMGQAAGAHIWQAILGFLITGVGIPLLGVAALGMSRSDGLLEMSSHAGKKYGIFFTCLLYLTIGPFFAIPRCASTSFSVGIRPMLDEAQATWAIWVFSLLFFAAVLWFSLRPGKILTWIGKILTPLFLVSLGLLAVTAILNPMGDYNTVTPEAAYVNGAFFRGFLEGYNTMDALAGLAFGIVVVNAIRGLGVSEPEAIAANTLRSGVCGCLLMALIYGLLTIIGAQSRTLYSICADGGEALYLIAHHYFKDAGAIILAVIVTLACLKTAVGLITSCGEAFREMFPKGPSYSAMGDRLLRALLPDRDAGAQCDHHLFGAGAHVPVSAGDHDHPAGVLRAAVQKRSTRLCVDDGLHAGGSGAGLCKGAPGGAAPGGSAGLLPWHPRLAALFESGARVDLSGGAGTVHRAGFALCVQKRCGAGGESG